MSDVKAPGSCYGTWDEKEQACLKICILRDRCKPATLEKAKKSLESVAVETSPIDMLINLVRVSNSIEEGEFDGNKMYRWSLGKITVAKTGEILIETEKLKMLFNKDSLKHSHVNKVWELIQ